MDQILINQLQFYTPPQVIKRAFSDQKKCYEIARYIIDREFKHRPKGWKTIAFPEYDDFFQAAVSGFNPYKKPSPARDKGLLQAVESYNPHKKQDESFLKTITNEEQAICPSCAARGELVGLWPHSAGNTAFTADLAPDPLFHKGNKYCGRELDELAFTPEDISIWTEKELIRLSGKRILCNHKNRLASLKNYIISQVTFLVQDIRSAEYHSSRSLKRHPFYPCTKCGSPTPDFNTSTTHKTEELHCHECDTIFEIKDFENRGSNKIIWQARGSTSTIPFNEYSNDPDNKSSYEEIISNYSLTSRSNDPAVFHGNIEFERSALYDQLLSRIRTLAASCLSQKQLDKLMLDPTVKKIDGVPVTQNFQIFYNYFFIDDIKKKKDHDGRAKNKSDETSTYRELALQFLQKEQHYTKCSDCSSKMYEPTESAKFKKAGAHSYCEECKGTNVVYHGPKCGRPGSLNPNCRAHGNIEIVMYIFQTIEPKIRRLEELVRNDKTAAEIYERIRELMSAREELDAFQDMVKILNY